MYHYLQGFVHPRWLALGFLNHRTEFFRNDWQKMVKGQELYYSHTIHVWYIYLHENHKNQSNVGKSTIHGWYGIGVCCDKRYFGISAMMWCNRTGKTESSPPPQPEFFIGKGFYQRWHTFDLLKYYETDIQVFKQESNVVSKFECFTQVNVNTFGMFIFNDLNSDERNSTVNRSLSSSELKETRFQWLYHTVLTGRVGLPGKEGEMMYCSMKFTIEILVVVAEIIYVHQYTLGNDPIWLYYLFQIGLVQPPTGDVFVFQ